MTESYLKRRGQEVSLQIECVDRKIGQLVEAFLQDTLIEADRRLFLAHKAACLFCEEQVSDFRRISERLEKRLSGELEEAQILVKAARG